MFGRGKFKTIVVCTSQLSIFSGNHIIIQGINFVDKIYVVLSNRPNINKDKIHEQVKRWLRILYNWCLLHSINDLKACIKLFVDGKQEVLQATKTDTTELVKLYIISLLIHLLSMFYRLLKLLNRNYLISLLTNSILSTRPGQIFGP